CATDPPRTGRPTRTDPPPGDVRGPSGIVEGRPETSGTRRTALSGERGNAIGAVEEVRPPEVTAPADGTTATAEPEPTPTEPEPTTADGGTPEPAPTPPGSTPPAPAG